MMSPSILKIVPLLLDSYIYVFAGFLAVHCILVLGHNFIDQSCDCLIKNKVNRLTKN